MRLVARHGFCAILLCGTMFSGPAHAGQWMRIGAQTSIPYGHTIYCQHYPGTCGAQSPQMPTAADLQVAANINVAVNRSLALRADIEMHGAQDVWTYARSYGDCEDYALHKRARLINSGVHPSNALLTMVRLPDGGLHIVVTLRTSQGDFVLDSLKDEIRPWNATGYRFLKVQSPDNAGQWRKISGGTNSLTS